MPGEKERRAGEWGGVRASASRAGGSPCAIRGSGESRSCNKKMLVPERCQLITKDFLVRTVLAIVCVIGAGAARPASGQTTRTTVILEVLAPEDARVFIENEDTRSRGALRRFESPPLAPGKYTYTVRAIIEGPNGEQTATRVVDVRPGDFEEIDFRPKRKGERVPDVMFEATPEKVVDELLTLAKLNPGDVVWDLGSGDGRIPVEAARRYGIEARGFDIDPKCVAEARANAKKNGVERLVAIEDRDIFTLDLSRGPTVVTLYLLPSLNVRLLPQLRKLPAGARVISVGHRMGDIPPDEKVTVDAEDGDYTVYLWKVETLRRYGTQAEEKPRVEEAKGSVQAAPAVSAGLPWSSPVRRNGRRGCRR